MSNKDVISELKSKTKAYASVIMKNNKPMTASYFSQMCTKIESEITHIRTAKKFFGLFGYVGEWNNFERKD